MTITTNAPQRLLVLLMVIVAASLLLLVSAVRADGGPVATETYVVQTGDTLWEIAAGHTTNGGDVRHAVYELRSLNGLSGSTIKPGQRLEVPAGSG